MRLLFLAPLCSLVALVVASPILIIDTEAQDNYNIIVAPLEGRDIPPAGCAKIQNLVNLFKVKNATPFCSSFLQIPTQTIYTTDVVPTTTTQTDNTVVFTTVTVVARTNTDTVSQTNTIATLPTIVQTSVVQSISTVYSTITPPRVTVTTTVWTTPAAKRDIKKRANPVPAYAAGFASSAISEVCSCLAIPTPSVTQTVTEYASNTIYTTLTAVSTDTSLSTAQTTVTITFYTTLYVPTTSFTTTVLVTTVPTTIAAPTSTVSVLLPLPTVCQNILSGNKLATSAGPARQIGPTADTSLQRFFPERSEFTLSQCCAYMYTLTNVGVWFLSDRGSAAGALRYACQPWLNSEQSSAPLPVTG
ncbi:hypothetical protein H072_9157 [Dactylellina haptotyla CBS 200.50]|uniref:Ig-like domain-containing protein n=1 Tax=Dactylellina haptotyla (strain CBS 200.50) TaxID=1284197 RepID=S8A386_DACHA|nr:hypothetical protein H072_9157 [Dactylellina haptotyla CBS 200.50]